MNLQNYIYHLLSFYFRMVNKEEFEKIFTEQAINFWKTSYSKVIYNYLKQMREHTHLAFRSAEFDAVKDLTTSCKMPKNAKELTNIVEAPFFRTGISQLVDYLYDADYGDDKVMDPKTISDDTLKTVWRIILGGRSELLRRTDEFQKRLVNNFDRVIQFFYDLQLLDGFEKVSPEFYNGISDLYTANRVQSGTTETYSSLQGIYMNFIGSLESHFSKFIKPKDPNAGAFNKFDDYLFYYESTGRILRPFHDALHETPGSGFEVLPEHRSLFNCMRPEIADAIKYNKYAFLSDNKINYSITRISHEEFDQLCEDSNIVNTNVQWLFLVFSYRNCLKGNLCKQSYKGDDLRGFQRSTKEKLQGIDVFLKYCMPV